MTEYYRDPAHIDEVSNIDMSKVDEMHAKLASWIRQKMYGVDVREALARLVELTSSDLYDVDQVSNTLKELSDKLSSDWEREYNALVDEWKNTISGITVDSELINARIDLHGMVYTTLKERLDAEQIIVNSLNPNYELLSIEHNLKEYPLVRVMSWNYNIGLDVFGEEPEFGGSEGKIIVSTASYYDLNNAKIFIPEMYKMENPEIIQVSLRKYILNEGIRTLQIELMEVK